jgi:antirestriction protein ArdC
MKRDLYSEVTAKIIAELEAGALPWVKPWAATPGANVPCNAVTNRPYSGVNVILLWLARAEGWATPRFLTFKQAIDAGGNVRKGEKASRVVFVKQLRVARARARARAPARSSRRAALSPCYANIAFLTSRNVTACPKRL